MCWQGGHPGFAKLEEAKILPIDRSKPCEHKTHMYNLVIPPPFEGVEEQAVYTTCIKNEEVSLRKRHLLNEGSPNPEEWQRCMDYVQRIAAKLSVERALTQEEFILRKGSPRQRARTIRAFQEFNEKGMTEHAFRVQAFIKVEKWSKSAISASDDADPDWHHVSEDDAGASTSFKPPRLIQHRSDMYCALLGQHIGAIEDQLWKYTEGGQSPFSKGKNSYQVAQQIADLGKDFTDPVYILADHSKFDSCVTVPWVALEHNFYMDCLPSDELDLLMEQQYFNKCYTKNGIRYLCEARKMSGEYTTSVGDTLINLSVLEDMFRKYLHRKLLNGDDSIIAMERSTFVKMLFEGRLSPAAWAKYGFKTTWSVVDRVEDVDFCQTKPVEVEPGVWRMVRTPWRAISRSRVAVKRYQGQGWAKLVAAIGMSELACGDGVPMMQAWSEALIRAAGGVKPLKAEFTRRARIEGNWQAKHRPVTDFARASFFEVFGIDAASQIEFEAWCDVTKLDILPLRWGLEL